MKRFLKSFALMAAAVIGAVSCSEADIDEGIIEPTSGNTTLYAATAAETKVSFEENTTDETIDLSWEADDTFTVYDGDDKVGTFTCTDIESGRFESTDATLTKGATYTAKYNEDADPSSQNGDELNDLDGACQMEAEFTYDTETTLVFDHTMAIMSFTFTSVSTPAQLEFQNGSATYLVTYSNIEPVNGYYTSHIMIAPCEATERTLTFTLLNSEGTAYDIRTVTTDKAYLAGYRYTAPVSDLDPTIMVGNGTETDPYLISTAAQLRTLSTNISSGITTYSGEYFLMTNDIDLNNESFTQIGNSISTYFGGTFDGGGYEISGLSINASNTQGLFGVIADATIQNLGVSGSVTSTNAYAGGIVGYAYTNCSIINCYNKASVAGSSCVGGIVGCCKKSTIINCYNTGSVEGSTYVGGVVGSLESSDSEVIINCYNTGYVKGSSDYVGGIAGRLYDYTNGDDSIVNCYNAGSVEGSGDYIGGVVGYLRGGMVSCYYNSANYSGDGVGSYYALSTNVTSTAMTTSQMQATTFVSTLNGNASSYNNTNPDATQCCVWKAVDNGYPTLDLGNYYFSDIEYDNGVYNIYSANGLRAFADLVNGSENSTNATTEGDDAYFSFGTAQTSINGALLTNIDLGGEAWTPIGTGEYETTAYAGEFDGGGYSVTGLYVVASTTYQGLFGSVVSGTVKNLSVGGSVTVSSAGTCGVVIGYCKHATIISCTALEGSSVSGESNNVAGISGYAYNTTFTDCHNNASVNGVYYTGGISGWCNGAMLVSFTNCSNTGTITSSGDSVGGIAGKIFGTSTVVHTLTNCFNSGYISSTGSHVGGLVGACSGGAIYNSYNLGEVYGASSNVGGLVGIFEDNSDFGAVMNNSYTSATVSGGSNVGLAVGTCDASTITDCYYDYSQSGSAIGSGSGGVYAVSNMMSSDFASLLTDNAYNYNITTACAWTTASNDYPTFNSTTEPTATSYSSCTLIGVGTESDPYILRKGAQLHNLASYINSAIEEIYSFFKMECDIDLEDASFAGIGTSYAPFYGAFDGGSHEISGLNVSTSSSHKGLFGYINNATIMNLGVSGSVSGSTHVGGIAGYSTSSTIENCYSKVTVSGSSANVGGIVGSATATATEDTSLIKSTIENCYYRGESVSGTNNIGGIVGTGYYVAVSNCYSSTSTVSASSGYSGGVMGYLDTYGSASNCYYNSTLYSSSSAIGYTPSSTTTSNVSGKTTSAMTGGSFAATLGSGFKEDSGSINGGYPVLSWE